MTLFTLIGRLIFILFACFGCDEQKDEVALDDMQISGEQAGETITAGEQAGETITAGEQAGETITAGEQAGEQAGFCNDQRDQQVRLAAVSFPYSETLGEERHTVQVYQVTLSLNFTEWGERIELNSKTSTLQFSKDGAWLIAVSELGEISLIDLRGSEPVFSHLASLPSGSYSTLTPSPTERQFDIINGNSDERAGIYSFKVGCEGEIDIAESFYPLRLIQGFKRLKTDPKQAIVFGGQALFEPVDQIDLRWLEDQSMNTSESTTPNSTASWTEITQLDVFEDFIDAINVGVSPLGDWVTLVNGSPFTDEGGQVRFIEMSQNPPLFTEHSLFEGFNDVRGSWFMPDGQTVMITQAEDNAVQFFQLSDTDWRVAQRLERIGLPSQVAFLSASNQDSTLTALIPSVSPSTGISEITILNILDGDTVMTLPSFSLGNGYENIPRAVATWPLVH